MKKTSFIIILTFFSCEDMLDLSPSDILVPEIAERQLETFQGLINAAYNVLQTEEYYRSGFLLSADALADNVESVEIRAFEGQVNNSIGAHFNIWNIYSGINSCNLVIDKIENLITTESEKKTVFRLKAEAYFLRALMYFDLHRAYAYEPEVIVNGWNKGVILRKASVTKTEEADLRGRSTVEQGYRLIESDLEQAIDLFEKSGGRSVYRGNLGASHALLARLYLYWNKWELAIEHVDSAEVNSQARLVAAEDYVDSFISDPHPESVFELDFNATDTDFPGKILGSMRSLTNYTDDLAVHYFSAVATDDLVSAFEVNDIRRSLIKATDVGTSTYQMVDKWRGAESHGAGFVDNIPIIRYSELLLIKAEAFLNLENPDEALEALNYLRSHRGLMNLSPALSGTALFDQILKERRLEFFFEGHRWFDLKRTGSDIKKAKGSNLAYHDFRLLAPIPLNQVILNGKLDQNPGY